MGRKSSGIGLMLALAMAGCGVALNISRPHIPSQ